MPDDFQLIVEHCTELKNQYATRNSDDDEFEKEYLMDWTEDKPTEQDAKITVSPDGHNAILGVDRLLASTSPKFSVPVDKGDNAVAKKADQMEKFANALWYINGRIRQSPLEGDMVHSAALFAEFCAGVTSTKDLVEQAKGGSKAAQARVERIAKMTPVIIDIYDPRTCYPEFDGLGITAFYRQSKVKSGVLLDAWGKAAIAAGMAETDRFDDIEYCDYWDFVTHACWIEGNNNPIFIGEHGLPRIPIVDQITDGSMVHTKPEQQRHAFLYGLVKSSISKRQSLILTVEATNALKHGINPQMVAKLKDPTKDLLIDKSMAGTVKLEVGESLDPLQQQIIDPSIEKLSALFERKGEESTIYKQAMGGNIASANAAYSTIALLNQAGRLPLVNIQKRTAWGMGQLMEIAFALIKDGKADNKVQGENTVMKLAAADIIENVMFEVKLDVDLPMDERQNAQTATTLIRDKIASKRYVREKIMNIEQSSEMEKEIYREMVEEAMLQAKAQAEVQKIMQQNQPQQTTQPTQQPVEQGQAAQSGLPLAQPLDVQQIQGNEMPPEMPNGQ
jgi:hypothetical protein